jgi:hypothetical protein
MIVRYIDDSMRSRVDGVRLAISFSISSLAVYTLGPVVKAAGFTTLMVAMSAIAASHAVDRDRAAQPAQMQAKS